MRSGKTDKEKLMQGLRYLAIAFPFIFTGPGLFYGLGIPSLERGKYLWSVISVVAMILAVFFIAKGISTLLKAFFDRESGEKNSPAEKRKHNHSR